MKLNFLDCWKRRKDLPAFESGELPPERAEALAAHLAVCERCRTEWESLTSVAEVLRAAPPEPVVPALNLWSRIEAEMLEPAPSYAPAPAPRWKAAALPLGAALICAGVFAATGGLKLLSPKPAHAPESTTTVTVKAPQALQATAPAASVAAIASVVAAPKPTPEPVDEATPAPTPLPKTARLKPRRPVASPRRDPFEPMVKPKPAEPGSDYWSTDGDINDEPDSIAIAAAPPAGEPEVKTAHQGDEEKPEPDVVIRVERPVPARSARRDAAAEAEAAERRAADALGSPLDAVARAAQPRKIFP